MTGGWAGADAAPVAADRSVVKVALGASPCAYPSPGQGHLFVTGVVTGIWVQRGAESVLTGQTCGAVPLSAGDSAVITYSGAAPACFWVPA